MTLLGVALLVSQAATDSVVTAPSSGAGIGRFTGLLGIAAIIGLGFALSRDRKAIKWRVVGIGLGLQLLFALFVLRTEIGSGLFASLGEFVTTVLNFSNIGAQFVFGELARPGTSLGMIFASRRNT